MKNKIKRDTDKATKESQATNENGPEKKETKRTEDRAVKKGYNEKNPSQPQGAFPPDSKEQHGSVEDDKANG